jgi:hypothetical protein
MNEWTVYTDNEGHFTLAKQPTGAFMFPHKGPFATFAEGAAEMKALGVPGW